MADLEQLNAVTLSQSVSYLREILKHRGVILAPGMVLHDYLEETQRFIDAKGLAEPPATEEEQQVHLGQLASRYLSIFRLADACRRLEAKSVSKLTERLRDDLAGWTASDPQHVDQFFDHEYEVFSAAEFTFNEHRANFITDNMGRPSRYEKRVEFLIDNKWPVECKRPQSRDAVLRNLKKALPKIVERSTPGLVCISLDLALRDNKPFLAVENLYEFVGRAYEALMDLAADHGHQIADAIRPTPVVAVVLHYNALVYYRETGEMGLPTVRMAVTPDAQLLGPPILASCIERLQKATLQPTAEETTR